MRRLALAATLVALSACNPPPMDDAAPTASENAARSPIVRMAAATKPVLIDGDPIHLVTTTTSPLPPATTVPPTTAPPAPPVTAHAHPSPVGECGGWEGLVASYFPADQVATGCRILMCESEGNPNAVSPTNDHGLWQINAVHSGSFDWSRRYDPHVNTAYARDLWGRQGWHPWSCYR